MAVTGCSAFIGYLVWATGRFHQAAQWIAVRNRQVSTATISALILGAHDAQRR
ncbi:MAG TPA: hypothetical protein VM578_09250 [Candidatus Saccharimonadales bacterium]|nr:hypothetical protein [Candidatus Saccharimonadales bacterium]